MSIVKIQKSPRLPGSIRKYTKVGVLVDPSTRQYCYPAIARQLPPSHALIEVMAGEEHKNLVTCERIWDELTRLKFDRQSLLIILGGGVLGDMGGFCAATYKRGIDFMLIPTTLLSQTDASVGGKLGIDFGALKNHIGIFQEPVETIIATSFLDTLPRRELRSGFAEIIKHCLISDKAMWSRLIKKDFENQPWQKLVAHSVAFKQRVVKKDPREKGLRKILNFGHTAGHAIEGHFLHTTHRLFHGEAVAAGMIIESHIAFGKRMIREQELADISRSIISIFGKVQIPAQDELLALMVQDKKNKGNKILMALPKGIGKAVWDIPVSDREIGNAIDYYQSYQT